MSTLSQADIESALRHLGVQSSMALEVHSSMRCLGPVDGGAQTVIRALQATVGPKGSLVMPAFRISHPCPLTAEDVALGLTFKARLLSGDGPVTGMGRIADAFRTMPGVSLGEGLFRSAAWGKDAALHAASGFGRLIEQDGRALMIGVDIYALSAMHYVEDALPNAIQDRFAPSAEARAAYPSDGWLIEAWTPPVKAWHTIQAMADEQGFIRHGRIGGCPCMLMEIKEVIKLYRMALETDPFGLYGINQNEENL